MLVPEGSLVRHTALALLSPRRALPIALSCAALLYAQLQFSEDPLAFQIGLLQILLFLGIAPVSYRVMFPEGLDFSHGAVRLVLYASIGAGVVLVGGAVIPKMLEMGPTFLTARTSLAFCALLFLIGGWGLGRDIGMELSLNRERARSDALRREAELSQLLALRSHLDPHFLFNTLNAIAEWCRQDGKVAERAVLELSAMLREVLLGVRAAAWPLRKELELIRTLFSLHLLRDPALFSVKEAIAPAIEEIPVPPMALVTLAENAVKHGPAAGHRGEIRVEAQVRDGRVFFVLENPGAYRGPREGSDGLPTLSKRLQLAYAGRANLEVEGAGDRTRATLSLPTEGPLPGVIA